MISRSVTDLQLQLEAAGCHSHPWPCSCWSLCARCCACFLTARVCPHSWCAALPPFTPLPGERSLSHVLRHLCSSSNFWFLLFLLVAAKGGNPFHPGHSLTVSAGVRMIITELYIALWNCPGRWAPLHAGVPGGPPGNITGENPHHQICWVDEPTWQPVQSHCPMRNHSHEMEKVRRWT